MAKIAVLVVLETDHPALTGTPDNSTAANTNALRQAVIDQLPNLTRVVMVMPEEAARMMVIAHRLIAQGAGMEDAHHPPPTYVAPADRNH